VITTLEELTHKWELLKYVEHLEPNHLVSLKPIPKELVTNLPTAVVAFQENGKQIIKQVSCIIAGQKDGQQGYYITLQGTNRAVSQDYEIFVSSINELLQRFKLVLKYPYEEVSDELVELIKQSQGGQ
jgi:hypothetical protein